MLAFLPAKATQSLHPVRKATGMLGHAGRRRIRRRALPLIPRLKPLTDRTPVKLAVTLSPDLPLAVDIVFISEFGETFDSRSR
jgi:hypothetical protein